MLAGRVCSFSESFLSFLHYCFSVLHNLYQKLMEWDKREDAKYIKI